MAQQVRKGVETPETGLPEGWVSALLPEVCELNPPKPATNALPPGAPVSFVPMPAVDADLGVITRGESRPFAKVRKGYTAFRNSDVLMAKITPCMENGKAVVARGLENGLGFGSTEFHVFRSNGAILPDYLYHFIRQESFRRSAENEMTGSVGQKRVPLDFLKETSIPVPPLPEQQRIIQKLNQLVNNTRLVRNRLDKLPKILKHFREALLGAACSGKLTEDWRTEHPNVENAAQLFQKIKARHNATESMIPRDLEEIPVSWKWVALGDLIEELRNGISTKPEIDPPGIPILRISAVRAGKVSLDDYRYLRAGNFAEYRLKNGDLLFTRYNGSLELLGVCGMVRGLDNDLLYPDKLMRVRFDHPWVLPSYAEMFFCSPMARDRMTENAKSSAGQQGVSGANVKAQPFALPPLEEQREIVRRVEALFKLADAIEKGVAAASLRAERLTQAILAKAFRGELVPTEAELARREGREYEPASVLLQKIKTDEARRPRTRMKSREVSSSHG